jgi:hypothetical protein
MSRARLVLRVCVECDRNGTSFMGLPVWLLPAADTLSETIAAEVRGDNRTKGYWRCRWPGIGARNINGEPKSAGFDTRAPGEFGGHVVNVPRSDL